ncbi:SDR family NAD(P)-dependent oxidoreductase, partial [Aeromonas dhakensis]|uniref:SDR family NAD(P)-dependent oxidoreductase n=1 Tax=Aeromonas dhakensis TaxID=196024 RepID=UPI0038B63838
MAIHCHRNRSAGEALAADIRAEGGRAVVVTGDLADSQALSRIVADATKALGVIDLLVNNAAMFEGDAIGTL